eukprot:761876_1
MKLHPIILCGPRKLWKSFETVCSLGTLPPNISTCEVSTPGARREDKPVHLHPPFTIPRCPAENLGFGPVFQVHVDVSSKCESPNVNSSSEISSFASRSHPPWINMVLPSSSRVAVDPVRA